MSARSFLVGLAAGLLAGGAGGFFMATVSSDRTVDAPRPAATTAEPPPAGTAPAATEAAAAKTRARATAPVTPEQPPAPDEARQALVTKMAGKQPYQWSLEQMLALLQTAADTHPVSPHPRTVVRELHRRFTKESISVELTRRLRLRGHTQAATEAIYTWTPAWLEAELRAAAADPQTPNHEDFVHMARALGVRHGVPTGLPATLARHHRQAVRRAGLHLATRLDPPDVPLLHRLIDEDRDGRVRAEAVREVVRLARDGRIRIDGSAQVFLDLIRDPEKEVRRQAVKSLPYLGTAGEEAALELLRDPGFRSTAGNLNRVVSAAMRGNRWDELIALSHDRKIAFAIINEVPDEEDARGELAVLATRLRDSAPTLVRNLPGDEEGEDYADMLFEWMLTMGDEDFVTRCASDEALPWQFQLLALSQLSNHDETNEAAFARILALVQDPKTPVGYRLRLLNEEFNAFENETQEERWYATVRTIAESDPNEWIRRRAKSMVE